MDVTVFQNRGTQISQKPCLVLSIQNPQDVREIRNSQHEAQIGQKRELHKPLLTRNSIRLVKLALRDDPISCQLVNVKMGLVSYVALSYEWGSLSSDDPEILVDDQLVRVRRNLYNAFIHIRGTMRKDHSISNWIWIDALCIDQSNIQERNHQVQMMGRIYADASLVIAWLGPGGDFAMKTFQRIADAGTKSKLEGAGQLVVRMEGERCSQ